MVTRREALVALGSLVAVRLRADTTSAASGSSLPATALRAGTVDAAAMKFGYAAITWGAELTQAMDDIAAVGFHGIQLRSEAFQQYGDKPAALRDALAARQLTFVALSSGNLSIDPAREKEELARHLAHAKFLRDAGGRYLQIIDERPKGRTVVAGDYRRLGKLLTELGKRTSDLGIPIVYHHHMNSTGEKPHEVAAVLDAADRTVVRVLFDTAHYQQGGGDPVAAIRQYREWIEVLHLKDVRAAAGGAGAYQFVELGRGRVDLPGVFAALREINFTGWGIVELDRVPDPGGSPKQSAETNKRYLVDTLHQRV
jgi:inosose dehydratase